MAGRQRDALYRGPGPQSDRGRLRGRRGPSRARRGRVKTLPEARDEASVLTVRVDLDGTKPIVWRRLAIRSDLTATELHGILQAAMGWSDGHLHRFWVGPAKRLWTGPHLVNDLDEHEWDDDESRSAGHEDAVEVDQLLRRAGDRLFYTYDFGDGWDHSITVESVRSATDDDPPAVCLDGRRACPLEDCGGPGGHNEIVAALTAGTPAEPWTPGFHRSGTPASLTWTAPISPCGSGR